MAARREVSFVSFYGSGLWVRAGGVPFRVSVADERRMIGLFQD